ncbi:polymer-forming cytoskeletal protein [uncultured Tolumonas sp.]|uniref:polymer-forming cytoskeletal protein n=1 Tax=uncultured Tolumonas sp. TaxID=263765 RepID=UPI002A0A721A|nr:polymer-forming cytoskeletal protein [uncultured Tolumonas sp.]
MSIGDDSTVALSPTVLFSSSNSVYSPVNPIHFSLSDAGTLTGITLNSASAFTYGVTVIIWDSAGSVKLNATATDATPTKISALSVALPAGDYRMAVMGACVQASSNNTKAKASTDLCVRGSPNKQWEDISFTNITLVGVSSSAVNFIQRQHIGDNTNDSKLYPPNASGISISYSFSVTQTSVISSVLLYGLSGFDVSNDSNILLSRNGVALWGEYFTKDGNYNGYPNITLTPGDYTLTISTNDSYWIFSYFNDADDISWDDIVIKLTPITSSNLCSAVFLYPVQGRADSDYIDFNSSQNYIGSRVIGSDNGVIGYKYVNQLVDRGYTYDWYGNKISGNCDDVYCLPSGKSPSALPNITNPFPLAVSSQSFSVEWSESKIIAAANGSSFKSIDVNSSASLAITASGLRIGSLNVKWNSTVTFAAGEYWIESLTLEDSVKLLFSGKVILHVKNMTVASHSLINSPKMNVSGAPENLFLILHGALNLGSQATLSGFIYQTDDASATDQIELISPSYIYGRVSAKRIIMNDGSVINGNVSACPEYSQSSTNHYELQYSSNNLTCEPASITLNACADSATPCTVNSAATDSVTLTAANSIWSANPVTLSGGTAKPTLSHYITENVKLAIGSGTLVCLKDNNLDSTCNIPFVSSAFSFNIPTFYAGRNSGNVAFKAVQASTTNPTVCTPLFAGKTQNINFTNQFVLPTTAGSDTPKLNNVTITTNTPVPLTFDSNGAANIVMTYNDAGILGINAAYSKTDASAGTLNITGSDNVAVLPDNIKLTAVGQTACDKVDDTLTTDNKNKAYAACNAYKKAGESFTLSAQAGYLSGSTLISTNNFTPQSTVAKPSLQHNLLAPSTGTLSSGWSNTALTLASGIASSMVIEGDVGVYQYRVTPFVPYPSYQDEPTPLTVPESSVNWSVPVGRIIPAQLKATLVANGSLTTDTCVAANQTSSTLGYTGQMLRFAISPMLSVTALGSDGATVMKNYQGAFAKITDMKMPDSANFVAVMIPKNNTNTLTSTASWSDGTWATSDNAYTHIYTFSANNQFTFGKTNTPVIPFETSLVVSTLTDNDAKATSSLPLTVNPMAPDASAFKVYSGRLTLESVNGAENNGLALPFYMQYWNGSAYAINSADNCTSLTSNALQMNNLTSWTGIPLRVASATNGVATTTASLSPAKVSSGVGFISFTAPNASGWVDIAASSSLPDWMKDFTLPSGLTPARASFGYYHGNDRLIYRREVFGGQ